MKGTILILVVSSLFFFGCKSDSGKAVPDNSTATQSEVSDMLKTDGLP